MLSDGDETRIVFLDISKAFDKVWHCGLLYKLKGYGVSGNMLNWVESYLHERKQRTIIQGEASRWNLIKAGVPQGSVLGPLLFLVFINDIVKCINKCNVHMFADDTILFASGKNRTELSEQLNEDLQAISNWSKTWIVSFSPPKTKSMLISNKAFPDVLPPLIFNNHVIENVKQHKHLGVILSSDLKWNKHIESLILSSSNVKY